MHLTNKHYFFLNISFANGQPSTKYATWSLRSNNSPGGVGVDVYENQRGMDGHENDLRGRRIKRGLFRYVLWEAFAP